MISVADLFQRYLVLESYWNNSLINTMWDLKLLGESGPKAKKLETDANVHQPQVMQFGNWFRSLFVARKTED